MPEANVEIVRREFDRYNSTGETDFAVFHPDLVYHPRTDELDPRTHIGRDEYERLFTDFQASFSELSLEVLELIDAGDHVIASTILHGHGSASEADVNDAYVFVYKLRDGLIVEGWEYRTKEEALEALSSEDRQSQQQQQSQE